MLCVLLAKDRLDEAIIFCRKAGEIRPDNPKYAYTLAFYLYKKDQKNQAVQIVDTLIQRHPDYRDAQMLLKEIKDRKL